jgi:hypothetical protein
VQCFQSSQTRFINSTIGIIEADKAIPAVVKCSQSQKRDFNEPNGSLGNSRLWLAFSKTRVFILSFSWRCLHGNRLEGRITYASGGQSWNIDEFECTANEWQVQQGCQPDRCSQS